MEKWVIVDTCIWASFFTKADSKEKAAVDELLDSDRIVLIGPILSEILVGFRRKEQADWAASRLRMAHFIESDWDDWRATADLGRQLAAKGIKLPLTDLLVAVVAQRHDCAIYTSDPHFDLIPSLKRYRPELS
jgi:predicted nucleic acid-binding protein